MFRRTQRKLTPAELADYLYDRLLAYYPASIPDFARERLERELEYMELTQMDEALLLCRELSRAAERNGHVLHVDGTSVGSLLVFLLMQGRINPLPAHYDCPSCGCYELASGVTFGLDLPEKTCPHCGTLMRRDGFSIPAETVWRQGGRKRLPLEYRCSDGFFPYGLQIVKEFYAERERAVVPQGAIRADDTQLLEPIGAVVLPEGHTPADYPQFMAYLVDGTPCFAGDYYEMKRCGMQRVILTVSNTASALKSVQAYSGVFNEDISTESLIGITCRDMTNTTFVSSEERMALQTPGPAYYDIACALTLPHNDYADHDERIPSLNALHLPEFKTCPLYCREDVFDRMSASGFDRETAAEAAESIGFGRTAHKPVILEHLGVPEDISAMAAHCFYLFPRGSGAQRLLSLMLLAAYMKEDPQKYFKTIAHI